MKQYVWDAENRLIAIKQGATTIAEYAYDAYSRRITKTVGSIETNFVYDFWNPIAEYSGTTLDKSYTWGMDLSGSMQGAGGVGGLLSVNDGSDTYYPTFDGNGNVSEYVDATGNVVAHYEYDAFGQVTPSPTNTKSFTHQFSTKQLDSESGLHYYGYRYFSAKTGSWINRDPIAERGGENIYGFVANDGINYIDVLGLVVDIKDWPDSTKKWLQESCECVIAQAKKNGVDPLTLMNSLAEENSERGVADDIQDAIAEEDALLADKLTGAAHHAKNKLKGKPNNYVRRADVGPANINMDAARSALPGVYTDQYLASYLNTNAGTADVGARLLATSMNQVDQYFGNASAAERIGLNTNAWREGPDRFLDRTKVDEKLAADPTYKPSSANNSDDLNRRLNYLARVLYTCGTSMKPEDLGK